MTLAAESQSMAVRPAPRRRVGRLPAFAYITVAPTLVLTALIVGLPLLYSLYLSFNSTNPITKRWIFVGFANYAKLFDNMDFWYALGRTAYFSALAVIGTTVLGMLFALVLNQKFPGRGFLRSVVLVPWAMAPVSIGVLWSFVYSTLR